MVTAWFQATTKENEKIKTHGRIFWFQAVTKRNENAKCFNP